MSNEAVETQNLFEVSWEVCNKVGGIYEVISSKAKLTSELYKNYCCIGPYFKEKADVDFCEEEPPLGYKEAFEKLKHKGLKFHYGRWLVKGQPKTILIEFKEMNCNKNDLKAELWSYFQVDSMFSGWEFEEPMIFSYAVSRLLKELDATIIKGQKNVVHCHEWMTGFTLLFLKIYSSHFATVFTTHSTVFGRSISSDSQNFYETLSEINIDEKAKELNIISKHTAEKASAKQADIFTTVSEITGQEASVILGREPEVIVMNGLDMDLYPSLEDSSIAHKKNKEIITEFVNYVFSPYYEVDPDKNLYYYLSGRFEFKNKGMDILLDSLKRLNEEFKAKNYDKNIFVFFFIAMPNEGVKTELLLSKNNYKHMKSYVQSKNKEFMSRLLADFIMQKNPRENVFSEEFLSEMKRMVTKFKREGKPLKSTHYVKYEEANELLNYMKEKGLNSSADDKVKVLFVPAYLDGTDHLLGIDYEHVVSGCHLGIFPSYYEPWGYTPLESAALGVPAITTDLAGFGRFLLLRKKEYEDNLQGIYILEREGKTREETVDELYETLKSYSELDHHDRVQNKIRAKQLAELADWDKFIQNYIKAHNLALAKKQQ